jgi:hypothetical protein
MRALMLATLCSVAVFGRAEAADPPHPREVRAFMAHVAAASRARDLAAISAALSNDCRIELRSVVDGREAVTLLTRAEYVDVLSNGFAALKDLDDYDYRASTLAVTIDHEPPGATVVSDVRETFSLRGRRQVTDSRETARVERRGGELKLVAVSAETLGH